MRTLHAYIDESRLRLRDDEPENLYVRVAVVARSDDILNMQRRHGRPRSEPMLWMSDALAGLVGHNIAARPHDPRFNLRPALLQATARVGRRPDRWSRSRVRDRTHGQRRALGVGRSGC